MNLQQWLDHLEKLHPADIELGLERVKKVYDRLNPDFTNKRVVVVGGTNGKGSTLAILASILRNAGFRVGIYTSPHILDYNERVRIENRNATDQELCEGFAAVEIEDGVAVEPVGHGEIATRLDEDVVNAQRDAVCGRLARRADDLDFDGVFPGVGGC